MKKSVKVLLLVIILAILGTSGYFIYNKLNPDVKKMPYETVTNIEQFSNIITDSFLDILIDAKKFDASNIDYEEMLQIAMRISRELNLLKEMSTETNFYEYVPENTIHEMIAELTGKKVSKPIDIEDFYYLYNETEKYYYVVPVGTDWIHINEVKEIRNVNNGEYFIITCSTAFSEDGLTMQDSGDITTTLKYCPNNKYIRYQIINMEHEQGTLKEI